MDYKTTLWFVLLLSLTSTTTALTRVNDTCVGNNFDQLHSNVHNALEKIAGFRTYNYARILSYKSNEVQVLTLFSRGNLKQNSHMKHKQTLRVRKLEEEYSTPQVSEVDNLEDVSNVLFYDVNNRGQTAKIYYDSRESSDLYLMVNTTNTGSACIEKLPKNIIHGRILTDDVFGFFKISPDGNYVMYVAESLEDSKQKYVYQGDFGETVEFATRPIVVYYNVAKNSFETISHIPEMFSVGQISWRPDSKGIIGVYWYNHPFPMACPDCSNRDSKVFTTDLVDGARKFLTLTPSNLHVYAPRLTPDGETLLYFANDLTTYDEDHHGSYIVPGPQRISQRLMKANFNTLVEAAKKNLIGDLKTEQVVVKQVYFPYEQHDGTTFSGLYPKFPLPERCFSNNGSIFYMSIFDRSAIRLIAVDLKTSQLSFHPQKDITLMDVTNDAILVSHGSLQDSPSLRIGSIRIAGHGQTSTTVPYSPTPVRTTVRPYRPTTTRRPGSETGTTTQSGLPSTTLYDPCEYMLQEIYERDPDDHRDNNNQYGSNGGQFGGGHSGQGGNHEESLPTTTSHPFANPLAMARVNLFNITSYETQHMSVEIHQFETDGVKESSIRGRPTSGSLGRSPDTFTVVLAIPETLSGQYIPLIVDLHGGPHEISTTSFQHRAKVFLHLGYAVLSINYRGSIGNGDATLQSILGNIDKNNLETEIHNAISQVLTKKSELDQVRMALSGDGFGGFLATRLNMRYPEVYSTLLLTNPLVDLVAMSTHSDTVDLVWQLLGLNYTVRSLPFDVSGLAWDISPLSNVGKIKGKTLVFVGDKNNIIVPEAQGIALYKALHFRNMSPALYHYPDSGNSLKSLEVSLHSLSKSLFWCHTSWATYQKLCQMTDTTTSTTHNDGHGASTLKPGQTTQKGSSTSGGATGSTGTTKKPTSHASINKTSVGQMIVSLFVMVVFNFSFGLKMF